MYYPMRMIRTRTHKYLRNLAHKLDYPFAGDLYNSPTWQGILKRGDKMMGGREVEKYVHRPLEELYDLENDPHELKNVAADPKYTAVLKDLRERLKAWQTETRDPWLVKYRYE
jgi:N-sulfoglucosamine sulfohydrolase